MAARTGERWEHSFEAWLAPGDEVWLVGERRPPASGSIACPISPADAPLQTVAALIEARWVSEQRTS